MKFENLTCSVTDIAHEYYRVLGKPLEDKHQARKNFYRLKKYDFQALEEAVSNLQKKQMQAIRSLRNKD